MLNKNIELTFAPHPAQLAYLTSGARFRVLDCGRRFGKSMVMAADRIDYMLQHPKSLGWFISPSYFQSDIMKDWFLKLCPSELIAERLEFKRSIKLINGAVAVFKSSEKADKLLGAKLDWADFDEAPVQRQMVWERIVRPMLLDTKGQASFCGTPSGKDWFYQLWLRGQDPLEKDWESWQFTTYDNPHIEKSEIEEMKKSMPTLTFRKEIMAEFLDDLGAIFSGIRGCVGGELEEPVEGKMYGMGVDVAKHYDYTVIVVMDEDCHVVYFERFNKIDWPLQMARIARVWGKYNNAKLVLDSTGVGDKVYDDLRHAGIPVTPYKFSQPSKILLIDNLAIGIQNKELSYPEIPELINELQLFGHLNKAGNITYEAPEGYHDDCVVSLGLAYFGLTGGAKVSRMRFNIDQLGGHTEANPFKAGRTRF